MDDVEDYFWKKPTEYRSYYNMRFYGYVDFISCGIALIFDAFVIIVLTRKNMISPINTVISHLVLTESLAGICFIPRIYQEYFRVEICSIPRHRTYHWELISILSYAGAFIFRHVGVLLGVMVGVWRYIAVLHPLKERQWCNMRNTRISIVAAYITVVLATTIVSFCISFGPAVKLLDQNGCITSNYTIGENITIYEFQMPFENYPVLFSLGFFCSGFFMKTVPSILLTWISYKLVACLIKNGEIRKKMITSKRKNTYNTRMKLRITKQTDRTTMILLVILMLFMIGEIPHAIYSLLSAYYGPKFFWLHYFFWMEIFNAITILTGSFNFPIYYVMSSQFRITFKALFNNKRNKLVSPQISATSSSGFNKKQNDSNKSTSITTINSVLDLRECHINNNFVSDENNKASKL